jgi:hypothetical protein
MDIVKIGKAAPDEVVVATLEDLLESAKNGKVRAVIIAAKMDDGTSAHITQGYFDHVEMVGFLYRMLHKTNLLLDNHTFEIGPLTGEGE